MKENKNKIESIMDNNVVLLFSKKLKRSTQLRTHICGVIGALLTPCSFGQFVFKKPKNLNNFWLLDKIVQMLEFLEFTTVAHFFLLCDAAGCCHY